MLCLVAYRCCVQDMVPPLIESIKSAGLVLVADTSEEPPFIRPRHPYSIPNGVDGLLRGNGILRFNEMIDI